MPEVSKVWSLSCLLTPSDGPSRSGLGLAGRAALGSAQCHSFLSDQPLINREKPSPQRHKLGTFSERYTSETQIMKGHIEA